MKSCLYHNGMTLNSTTIIVTIMKIVLKIQFEINQNFWPVRLALISVKELTSRPTFVEPEKQ